MDLVSAMAKSANAASELLRSHSEQDAIAYTYRSTAMKLKDVIANLSAADRQSRKGVFYDLRTLVGDYGETDVVVTEHDPEPTDYLLCKRLFPT